MRDFEARVKRLEYAIDLALNLEMDPAAKAGLRGALGEELVFAPIEPFRELGGVLQNGEDDKEGDGMRLLRRFLDGHRGDEHWRKEALYMAGAALSGVVAGPEEIKEVLERAETYLKFIQTGKAWPPL
jgi:hypothetical protein